MHKRVAAGVITASQGKQEPWTEGQIVDEYYFASSSRANALSPLVFQAPTSVVRVQSADEIEQQAWNSAQQTNTSTAFNAYLAAYPSGRFANAARARLTGVQPAPVANQQSPPSLQILNGFQIAPNGQTVRDSKTGLIWQRCSVGQAWDGDTCTGIAKTFTFEQAEQLNQGVWRLPTIIELASLIECLGGVVSDRVELSGRQTFRCSRNQTAQLPMINRQVFPNTPTQAYGSSVYRSSSPSVVYSPFVWNVNFSNSAVANSSRDESYYVRLVRVRQ